MLKLIWRKEAVEKGTALGYRVEIETPESRYAAHRLIDPDGACITDMPYFPGHYPNGGALESDAWRDLPGEAVKRDGYVEDYQTAAEGRIAFVDECDTAAIRKRVFDQRRMIAGWLALTPDDIERLKAGQAAVWCGHDTAVVIHLAQIEGDDCR